MNYRLAKVEEAIIKLSETTEQLVRLEERHLETRAALNRAFAKIGDLEKRTGAIETQMPKLMLAMGWVFAAVLAVVGMAGVLVWKAATQPHAPPPVVSPRP